MAQNHEQKNKQRNDCKTKHLLAAAIHFSRLQVTGAPVATVDFARRWLPTL